MLKLVVKWYLQSDTPHVFWWHMRIIIKYQWFAVSLRVRYQYALFVGALAMALCPTVNYINTPGDEQKSTAIVDKWILRV
ncbi:hypothetical protein ACLB1N_27850 [Escherichia coli]